MSPSTTTNLPEAKYWTHTKSATSKIEINWTIDNFSFYMEDNPVEFISLKSREYSAPGHGRVHFYLGLYPNGYNGEYSGHLSLFLYCCNYNFHPSLVKTKYKLSVVDCEGNDQYLRDLHGNFTDSSGGGIYKMVSHSALRNPEYGLLPGDQLTVRCEAAICFKLNDRSTSYSIRIAAIDSSKYQKQFSEEMGSLLANGQHSDVTLSVDGIIIPAHKAILSARSPIFAAMFSHSDTKEAQEGKVDIEDVPEDVFKDLLKFIYTGKVPEKEKLTIELLVAADKYQVNDLKTACENHLSASLSIQTAASTLLLADMHSANTLKANAIKFVAANIYKVMFTNVLEQMAPKMIMELGSLLQEEEEVGSLLRWPFDKVVGLFKMLFAPQ